MDPPLFDPSEKSYRAKHDATNPTDVTPLLIDIAAAVADLQGTWTTELTPVSDVVDMEQVARLITDRGHADPAGVTFCLDGYQVVVTDSEVVIRPPPDE
jgi:hypothetical protein